MPAPTFTPGDKKQDEKLNPGQQDYDRRFNDIVEAEKQAAAFKDISDNYDKDADASQEDANIKKLQQEEASSAPSAGWRNDVKGDGGTEKRSRLKGWFKKASPALGIGGILGIGGFILIALTSPSLLIVQIKETMAEKFNTQLASMESRSNKLLISKLEGSTKGYCGSIVTIRCKFTTMSKKQVEKLKAAGIEVEGEEVIGGRTRPTGLVFNGEEISPKDFSRRASTDAAFRSALKQAYNPKYAGFVGKAWANVSARFKISKQMPELNANEGEEKARAKLNEIAREGTSDSGRTTLDIDDENCDAECRERTNGVNSEAEKLGSQIKEGDPANEVRAHLSGVGLGTVTSAFKITGIVDNACQVHGAATMLSYAAKSLRAAQLARYFMVFATFADGIKGGASPDPADIAFLGNIATATVRDKNDPTKVTLGSFTDSFGYKYAAYGDTGASKKSMQVANRFMAGGGFVGEMSTAMNTIYSFIPGGRPAAKDTCRTLGNPFIQGASLVLGVAALLVPGANVAKMTIQAAGSITVSLILAALPALLMDIVAGTVTENIQGEESGNAVTSGAGSVMSDALAAQNGNGPVTKADAIAYNALQTEITNQYIADETRNTSPFDATNPHTFVGSIAASLLPLQSSSNPLTTIGSVLTNSLKSIVPSSNALSTEQYKESLEICQDPDVLDAGYAADPFCNVIRIIPPKYLDRDPITVADRLIAANDLSEDGMPIGNYATFINDCILNQEPLGYASADSGFDVAAASKCIINDSTADYYINFADRRVDLGQSDEDTVGESNTTSIAGVAIDMEHLYEDSTGVACAPNTIDKGTNTGYVEGRAFAVRLCALPNSSEPSKPGGMALVNSRVSGAAYAMLEQMKVDLIKEGVKDENGQLITKIPFGDSYRSPEEQQQAINTCGLYSDGGCAAAQGFSNHQSGVALDFEYNNTYCVHSRGIKTCPASPYWKWLSTYAKDFGYNNGIDEWWHWSPTGK